MGELPDLQWLIALRIEIGRDFIPDLMNFAPQIFAISLQTKRRGHVARSKKLGGERREHTQEGKKG
jgi:hypothetical protein